MRLLRGLLSLLITGVAVEVALAPIALYHFHQAGLYGALANIVAIPLTTFVIMPAEALALLFDIGGLGAPFWWVVRHAVGLLSWTAHATAAAPGAVALLPPMPRGAFGLMVLGGLWVALWRTRVRWWGLAPIAAGAALALASPKPDLLVTGDGRHLAVRTEEGIALLRDRAGDYTRDMLLENAGLSGEPAALAALPGARCSRDLCAAELGRPGERRWRLLATRSAYLVDAPELARACADADLVVSDRRLPRTCRPRWLKADRALLSRTGGLGIVLGERPQVRTVAEAVGRHPWSTLERGSERNAQAKSSKRIRVS